MKIKIPILLMVATGLMALSGCSESSSNKKTPLKLSNVKASEAHADKNGNFVVKLKTSKNANVKANLESNAGSIGQALKVHQSKNGHFYFSAHINSSKDGQLIMVSSMEHGFKRNSTDFLLDNNPKRLKKHEAKEASIQKIKDKKDSIQEKKDEKDAKEGSIYAERESIEAKKESQKAANKASSAKSNTSHSQYKHVSLTAFSQDPYKYDGALISTSGSVVDIQKEPDNPDLYYVVIVPRDKYSSSGYTEGSGTVTEIDVDTMKENSIHEGDTITVQGSGSTDSVTLNGKTLKSDIVVNNVKED